MEYELSNDGEVEKTATIKVPRTDLDPYINDQINTLQKDLSLKGFRKGKVPIEIIRSRYFDNIKTQALNDLVNDSFIKLMKERSWLPASRAELKEITEGDKIIFTLQFEIIPKFTVENYTGIELFKEKELPDDQLFEQALQNVRERFATIQEISRPAAVDDLVTLDLLIIREDGTKHKETDVVMKIGDRNFPDEVNRILVGIKKHDQKKVLVGEQNHQVSIKKVEEKVLPIIDDTFAKSHKFTDLDDFKKKLLADARALEEQRQEDDLKEKLSNVLLERTPFLVPKAMANNEYQKILQRLNLEDTDPNRERFWDTATKRARLNLILDWVAGQEKITVTEEETQKVITAMNIKTTDDKLSIDNFVRGMLIREKTLDFLHKSAQISEKSRILSPKEAHDDTNTVRH